MNTHTELVESLIERGVLKTPCIIDAFRHTDRKDFVPAGKRDLAYMDSALPIGEGQTISQPYTVAFMVELFSPQKGESVLEVGFGSGWQTAILARLVGESGRVVAIERLLKLYHMGQRNLAAQKQKNILLVQGDGTKGFAEEAPYSGIIAAAAGEKMPPEWKGQLAPRGRIVTPIGTSICKIIKKDEETFEKEEYPGFVFVALIEED